MGSSSMGARCSSWLLAVMVAVVVGGAVGAVTPPWVGSTGGAGFIGLSPSPSSSSSSSSSFPLAWSALPLASFLSLQVALSSLALANAALFSGHSRLLAPCAPLQLTHLSSVCRQFCPSFAWHPFSWQRCLSVRCLPAQRAHLGMVGIAHLDCRCPHLLQISHRLSGPAAMYWSTTYLMPPSIALCWVSCRAAFRPLTVMTAEDAVFSPVRILSLRIVGFPSHFTPGSSLHPGFSASISSFIFWRPSVPRPINRRR